MNPLPLDVIFHNSVFTVFSDIVRDTTPFPRPSP